ncbi:unnamed protein product, partial [marine sediment metagenome]
MDKYDTITFTHTRLTVTQSADAEFEILGEAEIKVTPGYGIQGSIVTIEGWNFTAIDEEEVVIDLFDVGDDPLVEADEQWIEDVETDSDGHFLETIQVPATTSGEYEVGAHQRGYAIAAVDDLRIGMMIVILSPESGPTGTEVTMS